MKVRETEQNIAKDRYLHGLYQDIAITTLDTVHLKTR